MSQPWHNIQVALSFVDTSLWASVFKPTETWLLDLCQRTFFEAGHQRPQISRTSPIEISFFFANDAVVHRYNAAYRGKESATNVLSFPTHKKDDPHLPGMPILLGDILCALETIQKEARISQKTFEQHLTHLIIHGTLHLIGYDHITEDDAKEMEGLEIQILKNFGFPNPYSL